MRYNENTINQYKKGLINKPIKYDDLINLMLPSLTTDKYGIARGKRMLSIFKGYLASVDYNEIAINIKHIIDMVVEE